MKAALLQEIGAPLSLEDVELDGPLPGEVRVRITASGLCHSDYHLMTGDLPAMVPAVLGHEAAGIVEAVGEDVPGLDVGDFVVTCYASYCGHCGDCETGHQHRCGAKPTGARQAIGSRITWKGRPVWQAADIGGFAEEMVVHHLSTVKLPKSLPPAAAALLGCGVLTGAGAAINGAKVRPGSRVAVIGCGGVGLNTVQGARIAGAEQIVAVDISPAKLAMAREFGATDTVTGGPDAVAEVRELTNGGVDYAFEVIGLTSTMRQAFEMLRTHGTAVILGMPKVGSELAFPVLDMLYGDKRIIPSGMGDAPFRRFVPQLAQWYLDGKLKLDELVSKKIGLGEIDDAYKSMMSGEIARSVIVF